MLHKEEFGPVSTMVRDTRMEVTPTQFKLNTNTLRRSQEYAFENIGTNKEPDLSAVRDVFSSSTQLGHTSEAWSSFRNTLFSLNMLGVSLVGQSLWQG